MELLDKHRLLHAEMRLAATALGATRFGLHRELLQGQRRQGNILADCRHRQQLPGASSRRCQLSPQ